MDEVKQNVTVKTFVKHVFTKRFGKKILIWAGICVAFCVLVIISPELVPILVLCGIASFFTVPLGILLLLIVPVWYLLAPNRHLVTALQLALLMIGLPAVSWTTYLVGDEKALDIRAEWRYQAAEELIAELEEYKRKHQTYPVSTGGVPLEFKSREECRKNNIRYTSQGQFFRVYFDLSSHSFIVYNYTYCSDWSKVPQESIVGQPTERANWRLISRAD